MTIANASLSGNYKTQSSSNSITSFTIWKTLKVKIKIIKEIFWHPPIINWVKCNSDGGSNGNPGLASYGGVFRSHDADFLGCIDDPSGLTSSYQAKFIGVIITMEIAYDNHWNFFFLETNSILVVKAFKDSSYIAWCLRKRWTNMKDHSQRNELHCYTHL